VLVWQDFHQIESGCPGARVKAPAGLIYPASGKQIMPPVDWIDRPRLSDCGA
jgi:hypothetical protein